MCLSVCLFKQKPYGSFLFKIEPASQWPQHSISSPLVQGHLFEEGATSAQGPYGFVATSRIRNMLSTALFI